MMMSHFFFSNPLFFFDFVMRYFHEEGLTLVRRREMKRASALLSISISLSLSLVLFFFVFIRRN